MKTKSFLILASVLLASVSKSLSVEENITGAFGLKLGQIFDSQSPVVFLSALNDLGVAYRRSSDYSYIFYPDKKFRSFSRYVFSITPKTRKIHSISAITAVP